MENIIIRKATAEDIETLRQFEQGVIIAERPFDPTLKKGKTYYYDIEELINSPSAELVVVELAQTIVACGYAKIKEAKPYLEHRQYSYLGFMYVDPAHRGKGIINKIIGALKQWTISKNITEMRLEVYYNNASAIKAYEKAGFTSHMIEMRMDLSRG
jgi:GNAT superfamily N-acetyltransferase